MKKNKNNKILVLDLSLEGETLKATAYEQEEREEKTIKHYEENRFQPREIEKYCKDIIDLLNRANRRGMVSTEILGRLREKGHLFFDEILPTETKNKFAATSARDLILQLDDNLVHIPWELLFDGEEFLCLKFNMGRVVRTRQKILHFKERKKGKPLKMLLLADPKKDLESSYQEGLAVRDALDKDKHLIHISFRSGPIDSQFVRAKIRDFDMVHYAGHADYDPEDPGESGWLLEKGKLTASDIGKLAGLSPFPALIFSNACKSGQTEQWKIDENYNEKIYGLANAFLLSGVQHYVGTFWEILDTSSSQFALDFYKSMFKGASIGEALHLARHSMIKTYGKNSILWASYLLYGDPTTKYILPHAEIQTPSGKGEEKADQVSQDVTMASLKTRMAAFRGPLATEKRRKFIYPAILISLAILAVFWATFIKNSFNGKEIFTQTNKEISSLDQAEKERQKRIDALVADLVKRYQEQEKGAKLRPEKEIARPFTASFLGFEYTGNHPLKEEERDRLFIGMTQVFKEKGKIEVVEREIIDKLLEELKLSSSKLADPKLALRIGRVLGARFIATGTISREKDHLSMNMRLIETETTAIKAAFSHVYDKKTGLDQIAQDMASEIIHQMKNEGKI
jgi:CHAT domain-containing protein/TolB-like protein